MWTEVRYRAQSREGWRCTCALSGRTLQDLEDMPDLCRFALSAFVPTLTRCGEDAPVQAHAAGRTVADSGPAMKADRPLLLSLRLVRPQTTKSVRGRLVLLQSQRERVNLRR